MLKRHHTPDAGTPWFCRSDLTNRKSLSIAEAPMGGIPDEFTGHMQALYANPMILHEVARNGDVNVEKTILPSRMPSMSPSMFLITEASQLWWT